MRYWLLTDTHFGHRKLEELSGRPSDFEIRILDNCKKMIASDDVLIHLGDVTLCPSEPTSMWNLRFTSEVPGKKILVLGNHDKKSDPWYYTHGWDTVCRSIAIKFMGDRILFSHIPQQQLGRSNINIHGHFHNNDHRSMEPEIKAFYNPAIHKLLAIEYTNYQPILLETFLKNEKEKANQAQNPTS